MKAFHPLGLAAALAWLTLPSLPAHATTYTDYTCDASNTFSGLAAVNFQCNNIPSLTLTHGGTLPIQGTINNSQITINNTTLQLQGGNTLHLNGSSQFTLSGSTLDLLNGTLSSDTDTRHITLQNHSTLVLHNDSHLNDALHWDFQGPTTVTANGTAGGDDYPPINGSLACAFNADTNLVISGSDTLFTMELPASASHLGTLTIEHGVIKTPFLPTKVQFAPSPTNAYPWHMLFYTGTDAQAVEKLTFTDLSTNSRTTSYSMLFLTGDLGTIDLSKIGGENTYFWITNDKTRFTEFSSVNSNLFMARNSEHDTPPVFQYDGHSADWLHFTGLYTNHKKTGVPRPRLQLNNPLPPLDLTLMYTGYSGDTDGLEHYDYWGNPSDSIMLYGNGIIVLNADQTISKITEGKHNYSVEILTGKTMSWAGTDLTQLTGDLTHGYPILIAHPGSMLRLTAQDPHWGNGAFTELDKKDGLWVVFGNANTSGINTHYVDELPEHFGVGDHTELVYTSRHLTAPSVIHAEFIEGRVDLQDAVDFAVPNPFPHSWNVTRGSGSLVLDTARFSHPEAAKGREILIAEAPQSFSLVLNGSTQLVLNGENFHYAIVSRPAASSGLMQNYLAVIHDWHQDFNERYVLAQPAIEAQIRLDLSRMNRSLWHEDRVSSDSLAQVSGHDIDQGLHTWINALGTYQKTAALQNILAGVISNLSQSAYAAGVNLGGEYRWATGAQGQFVGLSLASEYLSGAHRVGDTHYQEQRWNTGMGLRVQGEVVYTAVSGQWTKVWHQIAATEQYQAFKDHQHAFEASGEVGLRLHLNNHAELMPFVQYNWTRFSKVSAVPQSDKAQQHLQLGAYLNMPWMRGDGITVSNRLGVSTLLSILANDAASFQATWGLRLSRGKGLGFQLQTTAEYAPATQRRAVEVSLGVDYQF